MPYHKYLHLIITDQIRELKPRFTVSQFAVQMYIECREPKDR